MLVRNILSMTDKITASYHANISPKVLYQMLQTTK